MADITGTYAFHGRAGYTGLIIVGVSQTGDLDAALIDPQGNQTDTNSV